MQPKTSRQKNEQNSVVNRRYNEFLDRLIKARFRNKSRFAEHIGVDRSLISQVVWGHTKPTPELMIAISRELGQDSRTIFPAEDKK